LFLRLKTVIYINWHGYFR